eukprot:scaffold196789_cov22-Tisochrysis_lutea.AAC.2
MSGSCPLHFQGNPSYPPEITYSKSVCRYKNLYAAFMKEKHAKHKRGTSTHGQNMMCVYINMNRHKCAQTHTSQGYDALTKDTEQKNTHCSYTTTWQPSMTRGLDTTTTTKSSWLTEDELKQATRNLPAYLNKSRSPTSKVAKLALVT